MKTISEKEFKEKFGKDVYSKFGTSPTASKGPSYTERVVEGARTSLDTRADRVNDITSRSTNPLLKGFQAVGQGAGLASDVLESTVSELPGVKQAIGGVGKVSDALDSAAKSFGSGVLSPIVKKLYESNPIFKKILDDGARGMEQITGAVKDTYEKPDVKDTVDATANFARLGTDISAVAGGTKKVVDSASRVVEGGKNLFKVPPPPPPSGGQALAQNDLVTGARKHITPDYETATPNQRMKMQNQVVKNADGTTQPRIVEGKNIGPTNIKGYRQVNLTPSEIKNAEELAKIPGYDPSLTNLETHNLVKSEIANEAKNLRLSLQKEGQVIPRKEIVSTVQKALKGVSRDSLLLQKGDSTLGNYMRVVKKAVDSAQGNLEGILDVRQALDDAYQNARGRLAFGSDKMSALDEIHTAARDSLNNYAIKHAKNSAVKASFQKQTSLYRADDVINAKAAREGSSSIERVETKVRNSPVAKTVSKLPVVGKYLR